MDIFVLLITMFACFVIGVPIAYSLGLAAMAGAIFIGIPKWRRAPHQMV